MLHRSLEPALSTLCARRYDTSLTLRRRPDAGEDDPSLQLRLDCRGLLRMRIRFTVTPAGNDLYDVHCHVQDGPSRKFSYALGGRAGVTLSHAPGLGRRIGTFLLDTMEKQIGRRLLQSAASPPAAPSSPS
ncbi:MAG: hypothetical protein ABEK84_08470 [Salinibacter sp.]